MTRVNEHDEGIDVGSAHPAADYGTGVNHRTLLQREREEQVVDH